MSIELTTTLLTDETVENVKLFDSERLVNFCNEEESVYIDALTRAKDDFKRRDELINAFNQSVISFAMNYCK